ncbi:MAG: xanthine dehydrogenase accessory protein XdhC [Mangrovicoccus sp.]|nr:xanthine dehydrogenase accessory protein XdhC [Mangrovicoccus sp.]
MSLDLEALKAAVAGHGRVARVVVAAVQGSAPREPGAVMLVWRDGQSGTIGGGALEYEAAKAARLALDGGGDRLSRHPLGPQLGQCCGGSVTLATELFDAARLEFVGKTDPWLRRLEGTAEVPLALRRAMKAVRGEGVGPAALLDAGWLLEPVARPTRPVWIWGAGHVGRALVAVLAPLPDLAITWVDTAPDRFPGTVPESVTAVPAADPLRLVPHAPENAEHLILTFSHSLDLDLCHGLLVRGFRSCGLIGSATKWARFRSRLAGLGHDPAAIARITCPIGDPALGKHPQAIAVGVAAALLSSRAKALSTGSQTA